MPNRPMATGTKPMPSPSSAKSKVMRGAPVLTSMPTRPSSRPTSTIATAFSGAPCASTTAPVRPSTIRLKYSGGVELEREPGHRRARGRDHDGRDGAGEERGDRRDRQRRPGAALLRHLVAVEAGDDRRGFARHVDQDRGGRAAVLRAVEDAGQHDQRRGRRQREGERQQDRDGGDRRDARQHADQRADQRAEKAEADVGRRQRDREAGGEIGEQVHGPPVTAARTGIGRPSTVTNSSTAKIASASASSGVLAQPHVIGREAGADHDREAGDREARERQQDRKQRDRRRNQQQRPPRDLRKRARGRQTARARRAQRHRS